MKKLIIILIFSLAFLGQSHAGEYSYECSIGTIYNLSNNGKLKESNQVVQDFFEGDKFFVNRRNGHITGSTLPTDLAKEIRVVNRGSSEYDFKTIAVFENFSDDQWQVLSIKELAAGKIKPFIAFSVAGITTGICE
jgi:hypothetical protein